MQAGTPPPCGTCRPSTPSPAPYGPILRPTAPPKRRCPLPVAGSTTASRWKNGMLSEASRYPPFIRLPPFSPPEPGPRDPPPGRPPERWRFLSATVGRQPTLLPRVPHRRAPGAALARDPPPPSHHNTRDGERVTSRQREVAWSTAPERHQQVFDCRARATSSRVVVLSHSTRSVSGVLAAAGRCTCAQPVIPDLTRVAVAERLQLGTNSPGPEIGGRSGRGPIRLQCPTP